MAGGVVERVPRQSPGGASAALARPRPRVPPSRRPWPVEPPEERPFARHRRRGSSHAFRLLCRYIWFVFGEAVAFGLTGLFLGQISFSCIALTAYKNGHSFCMFLHLFSYMLLLYTMLGN